MNRMAPFVPRLLIGAFALSLLLALFILSPWWPLLHTTSDRINLAQLVIETAGFFLALMAGIFAAWEFRRSQFRPSLRLLLYDRKRTELGDSLVTTKDCNKAVPFDIRIHNEGRAVARFVKVEILFIGKPLFAKPSTTMGILRSPTLVSSSLAEYWHYEDIDQGRRFIFEGRDGYVCHPGTIETLGSYELSIAVEDQYSRSPEAVFYSILADRMDFRGGLFEFHVIEPAE